MNIKQLVTKEDAANCDHYFNNSCCLLATALKRSFPGERIDVSGYTMTIGNRDYEMSILDAERVCKAYDEGCRQPITLDKFEPFTVDLIFITREQV